jgi:RNA polymerase sigma factor (sigma-70 family)
MKDETGKGEAERLDAVFSKFSYTVTRFLYRIVQNWDVCEDLTQDVFLKVLELGKELNPNSHRTLNYLFTAARHRAIDYLRKEKIEERKYRAFMLKEVVMDRNFYRDLENSCISGEIISTLHDTIDSFSLFERRVYVEKYFKDGSYAAISRETDISEYNLKKIGERITGRIKENLEEFFSDEEE